MKKLKYLLIGGLLLLNFSQVFAGKYDLEKDFKLYYVDPDVAKI